MFTIARGLLMEYLSPDSISTHLNAFAIFLIYICILGYRSLEDGSGFVESGNLEKDHFKTNSKYSAKPALSQPKPRPPILSEKKREVNNSSRASHSLSPTPEEKRISLDYAFTRLGTISSLEESTTSERRRFLVACKGNVMATTKRLNHYLRWNSEHVQAKAESGIKIKPTRDRDYDLWVESCLTAMKMNGEVENIVLPRIIRKLGREDNSGSTPRDDECTKVSKFDFLDREGFRTFCVRPALMDVKLAKASTYTLAIAIYLDQTCDREQMEKVTLCLDVRAGRGWPNTHVLRLIPFMKHTVKILLPLFPERLHKALVYPVPPAFFYIWRMISKCLDPLTVNRVCVLEGQCKIEAPPPVAALKIHLGEEELKHLEACRINSFRA